jgi:hypothetical protein
LSTDPEKGLPDREDTLSVINYARSDVRGFVEVLEEEEETGKEIAVPALEKVYNGLVDSVNIYLQNWSANRKHEVASITKNEYRKADIHEPITGKS